MLAPGRTSKIAAFIAALACFIFALGVRDTPERPLKPPVPTSLRAPRVDTLRLVVEVLSFTAAGKTPIPNLLAKDPDAGAPADANADAFAFGPVVGEVAKPIANALVRVFWNDQNRFRLVGSARTNERRRIEFPALPRGVLWVVGEAEGRARASTQLVLDEDARVCGVSLDIAHSLPITVVDEQGAPLSEATVLVTGRDPLPYGGLTDKTGLVTWNRLGQGPYRVRASARGFESVQVTGITQATTLRLRKLGALVVRVEDLDQKPVAQATVTLQGTSLWPARTVTTNSEGVAHVRGLLAGSFDLRARKDQRVSHTELGIALGRGEELPVTLRLLPGRYVTLWVTDGEGEPASAVPNADVVVADSGLSAFPERGRTLANGKVTLGPFEPGPLSASATARDFVGTTVVAVPPQQVGPLRLSMRRGGTVRGLVVDAFDHPIAGASIEIIGTDYSGLPIAETPRQRELQATGFARALTGPQALLPFGELGVMKGPVPTIPGAASASGDYLLSVDELRTRVEPIVAPSDTDNWVTRYDGSFAAHPVTPGRLRALVRHPAYVDGQSELFALSAGGSAEVKVTLRSGGALEGVVVDRFGRSVGGVRVELTSSTASRAIATYTSEDGAFAFAALPSEVTLTVARPENPERAIVRERFTVREGKRENVKIVLPEARESVECRVSNERGDPIDGAEVVLSSLEASSPLRQTRFTGADGTAIFEDARGMELSLSADNPGYAATTERFTHAPARIQLVLRRGVRVTGRVTSVRGRVPVGRARVTVISQGRRRMATTDKDGVWQMNDVPTGTVLLHIEAVDLPALDLEREIQAQSREDRPLDLGEVDLPEAGGVSGSVVDSHGNPVAGAKVSTQPLAGYVPLTANAQGQAVTNEHGQFRLAPVAIGTTRVFAQAAGIGQGRSEPIEILRDRDRDGVQIRLSEPVQDEGSTAGASVAVTLSTEAGRVVIAQVAAGSEAARAGLTVGDIVLSVDGQAVPNLAEARQRLSGPENQDVLLEVQRGSAHVKIRTVREPVRR